MIVSCKHVSKTFSQGELAVRALQDVSIEIDKRGFVCLCGPSGSGKTTLLNLMGGLDKADQGEISVAGKRIDQMNKSELAEFRLHHLGFVFQAYNLIPVLSAQENVEFIMQLQGLALAERREKSMEILKAVGLSGMEKRRPSELSGGQQQRVAVARAIVSKPAVVLADEPTANLDSKTGQALVELMFQLNAEHGITFIFSTHDKLVMDFARVIIHLQDGKVVTA